MLFSSSLDWMSLKAISQSPAKPTYANKLFVTTWLRSPGRTFSARRQADLGEHGPVPEDGRQGPPEPCGLTGLSGEWPSCVPSASEEDALCEPMALNVIWPVYT